MPRTAGKRWRVGAFRRRVVGISVAPACAVSSMNGSRRCLSARASRVGLFVLASTCILGGLADD
jgi:hypothetical protein